MKFLGNVLATIVGIFVFFMMLFFMILLFGALFGGDSDAVVVENNSVLVFDMENVTNDYGGKYKDPLVTMFSEGASIGVSDIINAIAAAKEDDNIKGISILNDNTQTGIAQTKAIRDEILDFKKSGKFVVAYSNGYTQKEYYLNSVADTVYLNPLGEIDFKGLSTEVMFFKDLQEKSGVKIEVIRHGKYKSAVEPFLDNKMSEANREQLTALLTSVWNSVATEISASRKIPLEKLNEIANGLLARTPESAKQQGLIDKIAYEDEYHDAIRKRLKVDKDEKYNKVELLDYARNVATTPTNFEKDKIAIVYAQGEILSGEGDVSYIGEGSIRRSLQEARRDENVKAIVLRVDSPGGNALTSDLIWREIELTKKEKPVVVSMGNYAASGGYYIACNANQIFAENGTITGSIGVFGTLPNATELVHKIGINTELVKTHTNAAGYSPFSPLDPNLRGVIQSDIEHIYGTFLKRVADGRKMTVAQVDSIAQGRVWTGAEALKIGLVDKIGGMDDAIKAAAKLAKIKEYRTQDFPEYDKKFADLLAGFGLAKSKDALLKEELGSENYEVYKALKDVSRRKGVQAMLPIKIDMR
ncbi:MAG: signal peptide peptidase SppA [Flavobacterium sp.]|uniref:signal peptide peptidase SppA n=1 Tax=Flavobacterium sp. TaxID=239 RepID=UPI00122B074D|nr:signal peptide peptidase SppA [Flavobacterium sp.]RZJ63413.1 MAG: signal peptide peptidase SppA [Flavobacterium sp.]